MMRLKKYNLLLLFLMLCVFADAQITGYHYQAKLDSISESGFYNVVLTPEINAHLKVDCSDLRIINDSGKWVPHLLRTPNSEFFNEGALARLNIIKRESSTLNTILVVETRDSSISNLVLEIKNTAAERYCNITGSDDLTNWFILNDSIVIRPEKNIDDNNSSFKISFPPVNYKYLKVNINNRGKDPFNVINIDNSTTMSVALTTKGRVDHPRFENPASLITQKDSVGKSYIKITLPEFYHFDGVGLKVSGPKYYERFVDIYRPTSVKNSFFNPGQWIDSFTISNNSTLRFYTGLMKAKEFYLVIHNDDNPPLKIEEVKTYVNYRVATAWLEKGNHYSIIMGDSLATQPNYDLKEKNLYSEKEFPVIKTNAIVSIQQLPVTTPVTKNKKMIWLLITAAVLVLAFFTWKLITDMNKSKA